VAPLNKYYSQGLKLADIADPRDNEGYEVRTPEFRGLTARGAAKKKLPVSLASIRTLSTMIVLALAAFSNGCSRENDTDTEVPMTSAKTNNSVREDKLGSLAISGESIVVGDPGYDLQEIQEDGLGKVVAQCLNGNWLAKALIKRDAKSANEYCGELLIWHESISDPASLKWKRAKEEIGVDAGIAGFFDQPHFKNNSLVPDDTKWTSPYGKPKPENRWHALCSEVASRNIGGAVIPHGVVARSGYGDGGYPLFVGIDQKGITVALRLVFIE
jgi:hypothetical protein